MEGNPPRALILHGFTGNLETVRRLGPLCEARGIPFEMPLLRGHGTRPEDLLGVTWRDWYEDAEAALMRVTSDRSLALVLGLSMGGLVTLRLAALHPDRICGIVTIAAALELQSRLLALLPLMGRCMTWWEGKPAAAREVPAAYPRFPLKALQSMIALQAEVRPLLHLVRAPLLAVQSWKDETVKPRSARVIFDRVSSRDKEIGRFDRSLHEMLLGVEAEGIVARIGGWIDARLPGWREAQRIAS